MVLRINHQKFGSFISMAGCVNANYKFAINNNKISKQTKAQKVGPRGHLARSKLKKMKSLEDISLCVIIKCFIYSMERLKFNQPNDLIHNYYESFRLYLKRTDGYEKAKNAMTKLKPSLILKRQSQNISSPHLYWFWLYLENYEAMELKLPDIIDESSWSSKVLLTYGKIFLKNL